MKLTRVFIAATAVLCLAVSWVQGEEVEEFGDHLVEFPNEKEALDFEFNGRRVLRRRSTQSVNPSHICRSRVKAWVAKENRIERILEKFNKARDAVPVAPRDINWDGAVVTDLIDATTGLGTLPVDLFLNGGGFRQIVSTPELTASDNSFADFANDDTGLNPFSQEVNVALLDSNVLTVHFTLPDRVTSGLVNGFGAIFTDVEDRRKSGLKFYGQTGELLLTVWAPKQRSGKHSFVGAVFEETIVASVEVLMGDNGENIFENGKEKNGDFVVVDDFFFFLSDTEVPVVSFRSPVQDLDAQVIEQFNRRRTAVFPGEIVNIDWDAGAVTGVTNGGTALLDRELFLNGAGFRQITIFGTNEEGFASENDFDTDTGLVDFSPNVNFAPKNGNTLTLDFFKADRVTPGTIHGFGAIFTDVEVPNKSGMRCFDSNGEEICNVRARPEGNGNHQFIGIMFARPDIARIVLDMGDNQDLNTIDEDPEGTGLDFVATDDWFFFRSG